MPIIDFLKNVEGLVMVTLGNFINNKMISSISERSSPVYDPATGENVINVGLSDTKEVSEAISAADAALASWGKVTPLRRARVLFKLKALLDKHLDELAVMVSKEHGKVLSDAKGEITRGMEVVEFACGIPHLLKGEHSLNVGGSVDSHSMMMPVGVCVGISPFNFPAMIPLWMAPIAIACGNTFILKPSEKDPSFPIRLAELFREAGLPDGVFNVVNGDKVAVDALLEDQRVKAVSFVGSTPIAEYIYSTASANGKRVQALGGAKNHMVIMPDADIEDVVSALMGAAFGSAGERCMAISVAVCVGDSVADQLIKRLREEISEMRVGPGVGMIQECDMGPLVSREHLNKVLSYIEAGEAEGADLVVDGREKTHFGGDGGYFVGPCLFDNVRRGMKIYEEEIFGPVLGVVRVDNYNQAIEMINEHRYGNGTAIFTRDGNTARQFCEEIQVGMVGVNVAIPVPMAFHSFGGWKDSLFGPLHMHGPDGVRFFTKMKTITSRWPKGVEGSGTDFSMPTMS